MIRAMVLSFLVSWFMPAVGTESADGGGGRKQVRASGDRITQTFDLDDYTAIELRLAADMHVTIGKPTPLTIEADDNIMPLIRIEVTDGRLVISSKREFTTKDSPNISVTVAKLDAVSLVGAGDMRVTKLDNEKLSVAVTGAADLHLSGKTGTLSLSLTGSADVDAYDLVARDANVSLTGAPDANIRVDNSLNVTIVGAGDLNYKGDAKVTKTIIGAGDVTKISAKN